MSKSFSCLVLLFFLSISARATELTDLGQGLGYLGIHSLADSEKALRAAVPGALVLDLRRVTVKDEPLDALRAVLASHASGAPFFILVSPATPLTVAEAINLCPTPVLTLGVAGSQPAPRIAIKADAEADRLAAEALEAGTPIGTLISGKIEKERFDEAVLVQEFKNGNPDAAPPTPADPTAAKPADATAKPPVLIDRVLQRAVHLHRALLALRR